MNDITESFLKLNHEINRLGKECSVESVTLSHDAYKRLKIRVNELSRYFTTNTAYKTLEIVGIKILQAPRVCKHEGKMMGHFENFSDRTRPFIAYDDKCKNCGIDLKIKWEVK